LSAALERDLERLDPSTPRASELGNAGVLVRGIDALAAAVRADAGPAFGTAAAAAFGSPLTARTSVVGNDKGCREADEDSPEAVLLHDTRHPPGAGFPIRSPTDI